VCSLIIDRGSCANVVSLSMIEKLGLQATTHPQPYNIQWLYKSKGVRDHKFIPNVRFPFLLAKITKMNCGVM